jgi:hypothetical protein
MKRRTEKKESSEIRAEYDFSRGTRGKYARRFTQGSNIIVLDPDVAEVFPDAASVNDSLRALAGIIRQRSRKPAKR